MRITIKSPKVLPPQKNHYYKPFNQHDEDWLRTAMAPVAAKENKACLKANRAWSTYTVSFQSNTVSARRRREIEDPNSNHNRILRYLARVKSATTREVSGRLGLRTDGARPLLKRMRDEGYIVEVGEKEPGKAGGGIRWGLPK